MRILLKYKVKANCSLAIAVLPILICFTLPAFSQSETAQKYYKGGEAYFLSAKHDLAIEKFSEAIRSAPQYVDALSLRAVCYKILKQYDKAIIDYTELMRIRPDVVGFVEGRAESYYESKQYDKAINGYSEAIRLDPKDFSHYRDRGNSYSELKQYDKAITDYSESIRIYPSEADSWFMRGICYYNLKQYVKAITDFSEVILFNSIYEDDSFRIRGDSYYALKQYDKAIADYSELIRLNPKYTMGWFARGHSYRHLGQYDKAKEDFESALLYDPQYQPAIRSLANLDSIINSERKTDKAGPVIALTEPAVTRGLVITSASEEVMVKGTANDPGGLKEVLINGKSVYSQNGGAFWGSIALSPGMNKVTVQATDVSGNVSRQTFEIDRKQESVVPVAVVPVIENPGKNYAFIIAAQNYNDSNITSLENTVSDGIKLKLLLKDNYGYANSNILMSKNPDRTDFKKKFLELKEMVSPEDNVVIFFAGHGVWDENEKKGYWLLTDAKHNDTKTYLPNSEVLQLISKLPSRHTLLITDACFSGSLFKTRSIDANAPAAIMEMSKKISRVAITSGNDSVVPDESVFMKYLVKALTENKEKYLTAQKLFINHIIEPVMTETKTEPRYGTLELAGHVGGDFIFSKK